VRIKPWMLFRPSVPIPRARRRRNRPVNVGLLSWPRGGIGGGTAG
jgi:hypothetical protein